MMDESGGGMKSAISLGKQKQFQVRHTTCTVLGVTTT